MTGTDTSVVVGLILLLFSWPACCCERHEWFPKMMLKWLKSPIWMHHNVCWSQLPLGGVGHRIIYLPLTRFVEPARKAISPSRLHCQLTRFYGRTAHSFTETTTKHPRRRRQRPLMMRRRRRQATPCSVRHHASSHDESRSGVPLLAGGRPRWGPRPKVSLQRQPSDIGRRSRLILKQIFATAGLASMRLVALARSPGEQVGLAPSGPVADHCP